MEMEDMSKAEETNIQSFMAEARGQKHQLYQKMANAHRRYNHIDNIVVERTALEEPER